MTLIIFVLASILLTLLIWAFILRSYTKNMNRENPRYLGFNGRVRHFIDQTGHHSEQAYVFSILIFLIITVFGILTGIYIFNRFLPDIETDTFRKVVGSMIPIILAALIIFYIWKREATKFSRKIKKEVSYVINILIIYLEAGYTIDQSLALIVPILTKYDYAFANELAITLNELRYLGNRPEAWQNLLDRTGMEEWLFFVRLLKREEHYDQNTLQSLVNQTVILDQIRLGDIEERASRAGMIAVVPFIIFILPAFILLLVGPIFINFWQRFFS